MGNLSEKLVEHRFSRSWESYGKEASVQRCVAEKLAAMLPTQSPASVLEIGCGTGFFTKAMLRRVTPSVLHLNDISEGFESSFQSMDGVQNVSCLYGDAECYPWPTQYDWVVSSSAFQWFSDFPAFVSRISTYLKEDGLLAFSTYGVSNMKEIRLIEGVGLDYMTKESLEMCVGRYFHRMECWEEEIVLTFDSPYQVLSHLRRTGVNAVVRQMWTPSRLRRFEASYVDLFSKGGKVTLTYHPVYYVGRKIRQ